MATERWKPGPHCDTWLALVHAQHVDSGLGRQLFESFADSGLAVVERFSRDGIVAAEKGPPDGSRLMQ
jgi:hypothetical protein